jgi:hypothetical protein
VQPDIAWAGGFSECRRIAALAQAHHLMVAPHVFASAVTLAASLHFIASIPNGLVLEFDQNPNGLRDELLKEPIHIEPDGMIRLPQRPASASSSIGAPSSVTAASKSVLNTVIPGRGRSPRARKSMQADLTL